MRWNWNDAWHYLRTPKQSNKYPGTMSDAEMQDLITAEETIRQAHMRDIKIATDLPSPEDML